MGWKLRRYNQEDELIEEVELNVGLATPIWNGYYLECDAEEYRAIPRQLTLFDADAYKEYR